jgi:molybdopterin converting factor small subunit
VVASLLAELYERWPALSSWDGRLLMAVDLEYATRETQLIPGQEVALMPPVQGG